MADLVVHLELLQEVLPLRSRLLMGWPSVKIEIGSQGSGIRRAGGATPRFLSRDHAASQESALCQPPASYLAYASSYDPAALLNVRPIIRNSRYGQPYLFQNGRALRLGAHYTFQVNLTAKRKGT
jgi:hypothetical protein